MKIVVMALLIIGVFLNNGFGQSTVPASSGYSQTVDRGSAWEPPAGSLGRVRDKCKSLQPPALDDCFAAGMKEEGASDQAVAFVKRTGKLAYMSKFLDTGRVDVAYVEHPFRANENYSWFLVNGIPDLVDVDDPVYRTKTGIDKDARYGSLLKAYPQLALWPDDRTSRSVPMMKELRGKGQRFVISYRITNGCRACEYLATAWFAFDFEQNGNFIGTKFLGIEKTPRQAAPIIQSDSVEQGFTNPKKPIEAKSGQKFTIVLGANHTTGYRWQLADGTDKAIVELVGSEYKVSDEDKIGSGGRELWTFLARGPGKTRLSFQYVRPWEKQAGAKTTSFDIVIQ